MLFMRLRASVARLVLLPTASGGDAKSGVQGAIAGGCLMLVPWLRSY